MTTAWELRLKLCESANQRISILEAIADDEDANPKHRILAIAVLLSHGSGIPQVQATDYGVSMFGSPSKQ